MLLQRHPRRLLSAVAAFALGAMSLFMSPALYAATAEAAIQSAHSSAGMSYFLPFLITLCLVIGLVALCLWQQRRERRMGAQIQNLHQRDLGHIKTEGQMWLQAQILNCINEAVVATDLEGRITYWGPCAEQLYGHKAADVIGRSYNEFAGSTEKEHTEVLRQHVLEKGWWSGEHNQRRADGTDFWSSTHISLMRDAEGQPTGFIGIDYDITARKQAEEKVAIYAAEQEQNNLMLEAAITQANEMAVRAEAANVAKSEFLANMSHEIRTPMNGVIGMISLLLQTDLDEEQQRFARMVQSSAEALLSLINDILDFSKIEAKKLDLETVDFTLRDLTSSLSDIFGVKAKEKQIDFSCTIAPNTPNHLRGDPARLRQILTNLIGNAIKFTAAGQVLIHVEPSGSRPPKAPVHSTGEPTVVLRFSVKDTGIGIPADKQDRLFQQFSQVDGSTTREYGGTGLGLAISKQLVELMGGAIGVQSAVGEGSEFWFYVPLALQPEAETEAPMTPEPEPEKSYATWLEDCFADRSDVRILLAEDNPTNQQVALILLKKMGLKADPVSDGTEVLQALERVPYDLILMDIQMPQKDGLATTQAIRQSGNNVPIIAMTAHAMQGDRERCIEAGMTDYVSKPIAAPKLAEALNKWLPLSARQKPVEPATHSAKDALESSPTPAIWDRQGLLTRTMNDVRVAKLILNGFIDDLPRLINTLKQHLESNDIAGVTLQAHAIKGAAANMGGNALSAIASQIEKQAGTDAPDQLPVLIKQLEKAAADLRRESEKAWT